MELPSFVLPHPFGIPKILQWYMKSTFSWNLQGSLCLGAHLENFLRQNVYFLSLFFFHSRSRRFLVCGFLHKDIVIATFQNPSNFYMTCEIPIHLKFQNSSKTCKSPTNRISNLLKSFKTCEIPNLNTTLTFKTNPVPNSLSCLSGLNRNIFRTNACLATGRTVQLIS